MRISVRFFAIHRQQLGIREAPLELPAGASIEDAWAVLSTAHPVLAESRAWVRFARNGAYAEPSDALAAGDELAIIPPVAGGALGARDRRTIAFTDAPIDDAVVARLREGVTSPRNGAIVTFLGQTRESPGTAAPGQEAEAARHAGSRVVALDYEAFEAMARGVLDEIAGEIEQRFGVDSVAIVHRTGTVTVGESSVCIVVAAEHRGAAFDACRYAIDELKARAPIWKSERFADGSVWIGAPARASAEEERG